jgi:hypothetical protein
MIVIRLNWYNYVRSKTLFLKLWSKDHRRSVAARQVVRRRIRKKKHCKNCIVH